MTPRLSDGSPPTIVLLPGMDGTALLFEPFLDVLPKAVDAQTVAYPTDRPLGYAELEELVMEALPRDRDFVIVGESFSGPLATSVAARAPRGLRALVLSTSFVVNPTPFGRALHPLVRPAVFRLAPLALQRAVMLGRYTTPRLDELLARALALPTPDVFAARTRAVLSVDATDALRAIGVPVLALRASRDRLVPASSTRRIVEARPSTSVIELDGPHLLLQARPTEAWDAIATFLAGV